ncbi:MAG TPA: ABC transporter substrate-binding protein [Steroidobacteraceae bacterium]|jgi:putative ABC transport system substrate-binding protein
MRQHGFALLIAGVSATIWPLPIAAQQPALPIVGILNSTTAGLRPEQEAAFRRGLGELGYVEGKNFKLEYRIANDQYDRLPALALELINLKAAVIVAAGGPISALASRKVTTTVPVVFTTIADPVKAGLVESLNRPGGNVTGTAGFTSELDPKRLELLHQIKPAGLLGVLINPNRPDVETQLADVNSAGQAIGRTLVVLPAGTEDELNAAFEKFVQQGIVALLVTADPFFNSRRTQVLGLTERHSIPAIYQWREFTAAGGLMSYGPIISDAYRQTGLYVGRILDGAKPADLPVTRPTRFEFVINLTTAKKLGLAFPRTLIARADDVIE